MDQRLHVMVMCYLATIGSALRQMVDSGLMLPCDEDDWITRSPRTGVLQGGFGYRMQGFGCAVETGIPDADWIVVRFGPAGETCGFNLDTLMGFAGGNLSGYYHFNDAAELAQAFQSARAAGAIQPLGNGLYCMINDSGERVDHAIDVRHT